MSEEKIKMRRAVLNMLAKNIGLYVYHDQYTLMGPQLGQ